MENGKWKVESGKWKVESGKWVVVFMGEKGDDEEFVGGRVGVGVGLTAFGWR